MTAGYRLYTGAIATERFAGDYNRLSDDIDAKRAVGMDVEALLNGRHNMFTAYALTEFRATRRTA